MSTTTVFRPADRLDGLGVSEILIRSGQAAALKRAGRDMIILGAGEPDFDTPEPIKEADRLAITTGSDQIYRPRWLARDEGSSPHQVRARE